jgi:hypothetical protein
MCQPQGNLGYYLSQTASRCVSSPHLSDFYLLFPQIYTPSIFLFAFIFTAGFSPRYFLPTWINLLLPLLPPRPFTSSSSTSSSHHLLRPSPPPPLPPSTPTNSSRPPPPNPPYNSDPSHANSLSSTRLDSQSPGGGPPLPTETNTFRRPLSLNPCLSVRESPPERPDSSRQHAGVFTLGLGSEQHCDCGESRCGCGCCRLGEGLLVP